MLYRKGRRQAVKAAEETSMPEGWGEDEERGADDDSCAALLSRRRLVVTIAVTNPLLLAVAGCRCDRVNASDQDPVPGCHHHAIRLDAEAGSGIFGTTV